MQILVVDDSRTMRAMVTRTLRQAGFGGHDIVEAANGEEALARIRGGGGDIVLCDWNMPVMSGIELLKTLRGSGDARPFGFVTSEGTPAMRELAEAEGAQFLITKPFTAEMFTSVLGGVGGSDSDGAASHHHPLATVAGLHEVLETLLGRPLQVRDSEGPVELDHAAVVWSYVFSDGTLAAAGAVDLALAAVLGAGFGLLPPSRVADAAEAGSLAADVQENLQEVLNVLVNLYLSEGGKHVGLGRIWPKGHELPADVVQLLQCKTRRLDAAVRLPGYGDGLLSAVSAWELTHPAAQ